MPDYPPPLSEALAFAFRSAHPPPYSAEELYSRKDISIHAGGEPPYGLEHLPNLTSVSFRGCGSIDIRRDIGSRPALWLLNAWTCMLTDLSAAPELLPELSYMDITLCQVRDLRPLLELPKLSYVLLAGNPIDEHSFRVVYPELVRRKAVHLRPKTLQAWIHEREWELMQLFVERGLKLSAYRVYERTAVGAPGHTVYRKPEGMAIDIGASQVKRILADNPVLDEATFLRLAAERYKVEGYRE